MPFRIGISCYPTHGGSGAVAVDLASALVKHGHEVHVFSYGMPFRLESDARILFHEVDVPTYPLFKYPPYAMALATKLAEVADRHQLQILHAHYAIPHSIAAVLARDIVGRSDLKVVTTLHGTDITLVGADPSYRLATRYALRSSDRVTAVSDFLVNETYRKLCHECEIEVIPNFIDPKIYHPGISPELRRRYARDDETLLLHISNFRPVKRIPDVIRIFHGVQKQRPSRLIMVGDGPERCGAEALARSLGISDRVDFTGFLPNAADIIRQSDAFLLPSDGESFGLAALEAMACGVPVVGARRGGLPEVVRDGIDGILEPLGAYDALAGRLVALLGDPEAKRRMGQNAADRAAERYRLEQIVPLYEECYRSALEGREHPERALCSEEGA